jgi:signal transduction histidine kinase
MRGMCTALFCTVLCWLFRCVVTLHIIILLIMSLNYSLLLLLLLLGDRFRVEHVIINFLSNAVKFSPDGAEIIIQISERNPHSEAREEPRKLPEGPVLRPHKGGLKERDGRAAMWSRSPSFVDKGCKYCISLYLILSYCNVSCFILSYFILSSLLLSYRVVVSYQIL